MPSWNIHTAHVERLLSECSACKGDGFDANAFLFGNYAPDVYVGFMVPDASFRVDYCLTHMAQISTIPLPDADRFWDDYVYRRRPKSAAGRALVLGAWAHLATDRTYNERFRAFCETHEVPTGEALRTGKQADFDLFGRSLGISARVRITPQLLEAARSFWPYRITAEDVERTVHVADGIVADNATALHDRAYQLLGESWLIESFETCHERLVRWLEAFCVLEAANAETRVSAAEIRAWLSR